MTTTKIEELSRPVNPWRLPSTIEACTKINGPAGKELAKIRADVWDEACEAYEKKLTTYLREVYLAEIVNITSGVVKGLEDYRSGKLISSSDIKRSIKEKD